MEHKAQLHLSIMVTYSTINCVQNDLTMVKCLKQAIRYNDLSAEKEKL